jgi:hypothetical protein
MEVVDIIDNEDGSSTVTIDMTEEEQQFFIEYAVVDILKKAIEREKHENNICPTISSRNAIFRMVVY